MGSYVPNTKEQRQEMLKEIGFQTIDDLFAHIPAEVKIQGGLNIPEGKTELEVRRDMENIAAKNQVFKTIFRGAGAYRHFIPATVKSVISKENLLTAYTPYQAEIRCDPSESSQNILNSARWRWSWKRTCWMQEHAGSVPSVLCSRWGRRTEICKRTTEHR